MRSPKGLRHNRRVAQGFSPAIVVLAVVAQGFSLAIVGLTVVAQGFSPAIARAQTLAPIERLTFDETIRRAIEKNPSAAIAAAGILRAQALLTQTRSASRLQVNGSIATTTLNTSVEFDGSIVTPQNQLTAGLDVRQPLYAPARWARTTQAADTVHVAEATADDVRRQTALAAADAYLTIVARRRNVDANARARDVAKAHFDFAHELLEGGTGSRLNELRAQQELSLDEGLLESARLSLYRAQEALGILVVADGPVDTIGEPLFAIPPDVASMGTLGGADLRAGPWRTDLKLFDVQQQAAERALLDSGKDRLPYLEGVFQPSTTYPAQFFLPQNSWRFLLQLSVPLYDSGQRQGQRLERQAAVDISHATFERALTTARSEVRAAREAVASAERGLVSARAGASQAQQVVDIVNISFRAGAATNIEVIDAESRARDADTAVGVAEDTLRRARLELLTAAGRFP